MPYEIYEANVRNDYPAANNLDFLMNYVLNIMVTIIVLTIVIATTKIYRLDGKLLKDKKKNTKSLRSHPFFDRFE